MIKLEIFHKKGKCYYYINEPCLVKYENVIYDKELGGFVSEFYKLKYLEKLNKLIDKNRETNLHKELIIYFDEIDLIKEI